MSLMKLTQIKDRIRIHYQQMRLRRRKESRASSIRMQSRWLHHTSCSTSRRRRRWIPPLRAIEATNPSKVLLSKEAMKRRNWLIHRSWRWLTISQRSHLTTTPTSKSALKTSSNSKIMAALCHSTTSRHLHSTLDLDGPQPQEPIGQGI